MNASYTYSGFDGIIGPAYLLALPLAVLTGKKPAWFRFLGWYCLAGFLVWAALSQKVRMLIPLLAPAAVPAAAAVAGLWRKSGKIIRAAMGATLAGLIDRSGSPGEMIAGLRELGITHILLNTDLVRTGIISRLPAEKQRLLETFFRDGTGIIFRDGPIVIAEVDPEGKYR